MAEESDETTAPSMHMVHYLTERGWDLPLTDIPDMPNIIEVTRAHLHLYLCHTLSRTSRTCPTSSR